IMRGTGINPSPPLQENQLGFENSGRDTASGSPSAEGTAKMRGKATNRRLERFNCTRCGEITDGFIATERYEATLCRRCFGKRKDMRPRELNDLSGKEWAAYSKSIE